MNCAVVFELLCLPRRLDGVKTITLRMAILARRLNILNKFLNEETVRVSG